jgi:hypothetical protein
MKESEIIDQHKKDAEKALKSLETDTQVSEDGKKHRRDHLNSFLESLKIQMEKYEHFK